MVKIIAFLAAAVLFVACGRVDEPDTDAEDIRGQLVEIAELFTPERPAAEITAGYVSYFAEDATLLPANGEAVQGLNAIAEFYGNVFGGVSIVSNRYDDPVVVVDTALASRHYVGTAVFHVSGQESPITARNRYIDVLIKENGQWKMLWHSWVPVTWE